MADQNKLYQEFLKSQLDEGKISKSDYEDALSDSRRPKTPTAPKRTSGESVTGAIGDLLKAGERTETLSPDRMTGVGELFSKIFAKDTSGDNAGGLSIGGIAGNLANMGLDAVATTVEETSMALTVLNEKFGLTGKLSGDFRDGLRDIQADMIAINIDFDEMVNAAGRLIENQGRFALVGGDILKRAGEVSKAYGIDYRDMVGSFAEFEKVGIGAQEAAEAMGDAGKESLELGLQSKKVIEGLQDNLGKLNQFGFQNGVKGLERMVQKSIEFRMNMDTVFTVANKVFDPEGALDMAANLQVVGGAVGALNDPLQLMYMATNNVEGLQDAIIQAAEGLATYNDETGAFEVTGVNLRKARDMAQAFGIDLKDVTQAAIGTEERLTAMSELSGLKIDEKNKEFLTNIARMKDGKMTIDIQGEELQKQLGASSLELGKITEAQAQKILEYQKDFEQKDEKQIIRDQATATENIRRDVTSLLTLARIEAAKTLDAGAAKVLGMDTKELGQFISQNSAEIRASISGGIKGAGSNVRDLIQGETNNTKTTETSQQKSTNSTLTVQLKSENVAAGLQKEILQNTSSWTDLIAPNSRDYTITTYTIE